MRKAMLLLAVLGFFSLAWATDPFVGTWKLNATKSKASDPSLMHKSETMKIVAQENGGIYTFDGVDAEGKAFHGVWSGKYDGKDYPFTGNPDTDMTAAKKISLTTLEFLYRKNGKEVANWRLTISKDGKTMTATGKGKDAKGQDFTKDLVFDKQ
jgi:hypothetical protein